MTRHVMPSWRASVVTGLLTGLAIATRTGGIITHAYLFAAMALCVLEFWTRQRALPLRYLFAMAARYGTVVIIAWLTAIALWPWLQIGNPLEQFKTALVHFANIPVSFEFSHWGERVWTDALPRSYILGQLLARLPEGLLFLLVCALAAGIVSAIASLREVAAQSRRDWRAGVASAATLLARDRAILVVALAVVLPLGFLIIQRATIYDGVRHILFVVPMLAVIAGAGLRALLPFLRRVPLVSAAVAGAYVASVLITLAVLHPLEYVAMNVLAGGTRGAYDKFELDYWSVAATEALRTLEARLDYEASTGAAEAPPRIVICIPWRESIVAPILRRPWIVETDPNKADFIIETQRSRCAANQPIVLIDEVKRFDRTFAWVYARQPEN